MNSGILCALPTMAIKKNCWTQVTTRKPDQLDPLPGIVLKVSPCVKTPRLCILSLQPSLGMLPKVRGHHNGTSNYVHQATLQRQVSPAPDRKSVSRKLGVTVMSVPLKTRKSYKLQAHQTDRTTSLWYRQSGHPRTYFCTEVGIIFLNTRTAPRGRDLKQLP